MLIAANNTFYRGVRQIIHSILFTLLAIFFINSQDLTVYNSIESNLKFISEKIGGRPTGSDSDSLLQDYLVNWFTQRNIQVEKQKINSITGKSNVTYVNSSNIIAKIEGNDKSKSIILAAHHDTFNKKGQGANDNNTGVALLLELADYFKVNKPDVTLYFVFFAAEEHGLLGAKYFVKHFEHIKSVQTMINYDMVGFGDISLVPSKKGVARWAVDEVSKVIDEKSFESFNLSYLYYSFASTLGEDRTDHSVFEKNNIPSLSFGARIIPAYYHSSEDKLEYIEKNNLTELYHLSLDLIKNIAKKTEFDLSINYLVVYLPIFDFHFTIDISYVFVFFLNMFFLIIIQFTKRTDIFVIAKKRINYLDFILLQIPLILSTLVFIYSEEIVKIP